MHLVDGIINNLQPLWLRYFHTHSPPYTLIIITLLNNQSNIIQYIFLPCTKTVTETSFTKFPLFCLTTNTPLHTPLENPLIAQHSILTWLVTVSPRTKKRLSCHLFHAKRNHWAKPATSNAILPACGATVLVSRRVTRETPGTKGGTTWARYMADNFALNARPFRDLLHAANLRHGTDGFTYPQKEGVLRIFTP